MFDDSLHASKFNRRNFEKNQRKFAEILTARSEHIARYGFVHSIPLIVGENDNERYKEFYETLMQVVKRAVLNFSNDYELQNLIQLPDKANYLLSFCPENYSMGTLRPDFLIDKSGEFKINEINARFPINGYFMSYHLNFGLNEKQRVKELEKIPEHFGRLFGNTLLIKDSESDWDIRFYWEYMKGKGKDFFKARPENLKIKSGRFFGDKSLDAIILELKQREIYEHFNKRIVQCLQQYPNLNDLRTVLIGHDKRLLAALYDKNILSRYANKRERKIIEPHLIETYAINSSDDLKENYIKNKDEWVLKHALKGKSKQLYIGSDMSEEEWKKRCLEAENGPFVMQRKVSQKEFNVYFPHLKDFKMPLSGMLLGIDGKFVSQGCFRGGKYDPTGLWDGFLSIPAAIKEK